MESRVIPASGPGQQAVLADQPVDQGGLARVGPADDGDADGLVGLFLLGHLDVAAGLDDRGVEIGHALAVLGRDGHRLAEAQPVGLAHAAAALAAFRLVGQQDHRRLVTPQMVGEDAVQRRDALAGVHHEQDQLGVIQRRLGLFAHARFQALVGDVLEARGVDQGQVDVADVAVRIATVARHPRPVIDEREFFAHQSVEQGGLAHIGATDDSDLEGHENVIGPFSGQRMLTS